MLLIHMVCHTAFYTIFCVQRKNVRYLVHSSEDDTITAVSFFFICHKMYYTLHLFKGMVTEMDSLLTRSSYLSNFYEW